jgi:hypothetical protein
MLADAIPNEDHGKLMILLKDNLDVMTMQYKAEMGGVQQPSRIDILHDEIARIIGRDVEISVGVNDGGTAVKKKDIRKLIKFDIKKTD